MLRLEAKDGGSFSVLSEGVKDWGIVRNIIEDLGCTGEEENIPILLSSADLARLVEMTKWPKSQWGNQYMRMSKVDLFKLIESANYVEWIKLLKHACVWIAATKCSRMDEEEMKAYFQLPEDEALFTKEEEVAMRQMV